MPVFAIMARDRCFFVFDMSTIAQSSSNVPHPLLDARDSSNPSREQRPASLRLFGPVGAGPGGVRSTTATVESHNNVRRTPSTKAGAIGIGMITVWASERPWPPSSVGESRGWRRIYGQLTTTVTCRRPARPVHGTAAGWSATLDPAKGWESRVDGRRLITPTVSSPGARSSGTALKWDASLLPADQVVEPGLRLLANSHLLLDLVQRTAEEHARRHAHVRVNAGLGLV